MNTEEHRSIQDILCYWITFLSETLPPRAKSTFIELLVGSLMTQQGFVTEAMISIDPKRHWTTYYKWLQKARWSWVGLARQFLKLILHVIRPDRIYLAIDDTLTLRASEKAPGAKIHHQHGNKKNLAQYVLGQCWVSVATIIRRSNNTPVAIPVISRLMPSITNSGKLIAGLTLMRALRNLLSKIPVTVLVDSWYMRGIFVRQLISQGYTVIGQVRRDSAFFDIPVPLKKPKRGRPRQYGEKITKKRLSHMKKVETTLLIYGKKQKLRYRTKVVKARFLKGEVVRVAWVELTDSKGNYKKTCVLVSTDASMGAEKMIQEYALRWPIEPMFNDLKNAWGMAKAWQQSRQVLHRWVQMIQVGFGLLQLASAQPVELMPEVLSVCPWRPDKPTTPGNIRRGIIDIFRHFRIDEWWDRKSRKITVPNRHRNRFNSKVA